MGLFGENEKRVKFLCSHGGKILPRPSDGQLKYVGGETRLIAVPTNITFSGQSFSPYYMVFIAEYLLEKVTELIPFIFFILQS